MTTMTPIESATAERIAKFSTSDLAPILNSAQKRLRLVWLAVILSSVGAVLALRQGDQNLVGITLVFAVPAIIAAGLLDRYRRSVKVHFQFEGLAGNITTALAGSFADLRQCRSVWSVLSEGRTADWKRNAGATALNTRRAIYLQLQKPTCIRGSVKFPNISLGKTDLFFLPDAVLVVDMTSVTALAYSDLNLSLRPVRFIEDGSPPSDATVVDRTWRYVNKKGGPDRRFNDNRQLPVCLYGEMDMQSSGGLNARIQYSVASAGDRLAKVVELLAKLATAGTPATPTISYRTPRALPTAIYSLCLAIFGVAIGGITLPSLLSQRPAPLEQVRSNPDATSSFPRRADGPMGGPLVPVPNAKPKRTEAPPLSINPLDYEPSTGSVSPSGTRPR